MLISDDYKKIILDFIDKNKEHRGYQKNLAEAAKCHPSFLSQVLNGDAQLTVDQAANLAEFWVFNENQTEYFVSLVSLVRCSSSPYKHFLEKRLRKLKIRLESISNIRKGLALNKEVQIEYFSNWLYPAVHMLVTIPEYRTVKKIAKRLKVSEQEAIKALYFLHKIELVYEKDNQWMVTGDNIHLPKESPMLWNYQNIWKQLSMIQSYRNRENLHYNLLFTSSKKSFAKIKTRLLALLKEADDVVADDKEEEELYCLLLDCFIV